MAVRIRLARGGRRNAPFYRVVAADGQKPRDGKFLEILGGYNRHGSKKELKVKKERVQYWLSKGATTSATVSQLLKNSALFGK